jgi:hypothetical protein
MRAVLKYLLPYCTNDFCGFENWLDTVIEEIRVPAKDDADLPSVRECLDARSQPLIDMGPYRTEATAYYDEKE